jgi:hypothetical protein
MKNYAQLTQQYLSSAGLKRVKVKDAATGEEILRHLNPKQLEQLRRSGRKFVEVS